MSVPVVRSTLAAAVSVTFRLLDVIRAHRSEDAELYRVEVYAELALTALLAAGGDEPARERLKTLVEALR